MKKLLCFIGVLLVAFFITIDVNAATIDEMIQSKTVVLKSIPASTPEEIGTVSQDFSIAYPGWYLQIDEDDPTAGLLCEAKYQGQEIEVTFVYEYDEAVKKVADNLIKDLGDEPLLAYLNDIEGINYLIANRKYLIAHEDDLEYIPDNGHYLTFSQFSGDLIKKLQYSNFSVYVGAGMDTDVFWHEFGNLTFYHDGTFYGVGPMTDVVLPQVVYIPEDAEDIVKAIEDRLSAYYNVTNITKSQYMDSDLTIDAYLELCRSRFGEEWENTHESQWSAAYGKEKDAYIEEQMGYVFGEDAFGNFVVGDNVVANMYDIELGDDIALYNVVIVRDTAKANDNRSVITNDAGTGVEIIADGIIPLDTLIKVARITSGEEYDKIVSILKLTNLEVFDLSLYSNSNEEFITKLDNGKFTVKLPISEKLQGKDLMVYYVDEDGNIEEFEVTISEDGKYAIFETDHFSMYTLAEVGSTEGPTTGDHIFLYLSALLLTLFSMYAVKKSYN